MLRFLTAGESHGPSLTAILEGAPAGFAIDLGRINHDLWRRQQGYGRGGRMKIEQDTAEIRSGVRWGTTLGSPITAYPDSPSYFEFRLWGGVRFPVITAIYAIVGDHRAVVTVQAILGAVCWSLAAVIAGALVIPRGLRYAFQIALLLLGLTLPMTRFDNALLSESFSISVAVVLATLSLRLVCRPSTRLTIIVFVVAALWAMMRSPPWSRCR